jgi:hypothetical protein
MKRCMSPSREEDCLGALIFYKWNGRPARAMCEYHFEYIYRKDNPLSGLNKITEEEYESLHIIEE